MAWSSMTELSTCRAAGLRPKETLDRPRMSCSSGNSRRMSSIASRVHKASLRSSSLPVQIVKVSGSSSRSDCGRPKRPQANSTRRRVIRSLSSRDLAMPASSMVSAITAAPNLRASVMRAVAGASPSSKLIEFEHGLAAVELERRLQHRQLGRIDHQRAVDLAAHALDHGGHLGHLVAADEGACRRRARCCPRAPARGPWRRSRPSRRPPAARGTSSSRWRCSARRWRGTRSPGAAARPRTGRPARACAAAARARGTRPEAVLGGPAQHGVEGGDVLGRGAAAAADDVDAVLGDEALDPAGELVRRRAG